MSNQKSTDWILKNHKVFMEEFGITKETINHKFSEYLESQPKASSKDFLWSFFQMLLIDVTQNAIDEFELFIKHSRIYHQMVFFRRKYDKAKANYLLQMAFDGELRSSLITDKFKIEVEIISGKCCEYCNSLNKKKFKLNDVLTKRYLASEKCTNDSGCNCCYGLFPKRDEEGNLIPV